MDITINLPATFDVVARGKSVTVNVENLTPDIIAKLALHGLTQKIADAAASAKKLAEDTGGNADDIARERMDAARVALESGNWGTRVAGAPVTDEVKVRRKVIAEAIRDANRGDILKDLSPADRATKLDSIFEGQSAKEQKAIMARVATLIEEAKNRPTFDIAIPA